MLTAQSKITSNFARTSCTRDQNKVTACEGAAVDAFENEAHIPVDNTISIHETFLCDTKNRTNEISKRNLFFKNGLKGMFGLF